MYIVDSFNKGWIYSWVENNWVSNKKNIANVDLWKQLLELTQAHEVIFSYSKEGKILHCLDLAKISFKNIPFSLMIFMKIWTTKIILNPQIHHKYCQR